MKINFFLSFFFFFFLQELLMSPHSLKYFMQVVPCISQAKPSKTPPSIYMAKKCFPGLKAFLSLAESFLKAY